MWVDEGIWDDLMVWIDTESLAPTTKAEEVSYVNKTIPFSTPGAVASLVKSQIIPVCGISADTILTDIIPAGYILSKIVINNPGAITNATDQVSCGLSATTFECFTSHRLGSTILSMINVESIYSSTLAITLYIHTAGNNDAWTTTAYDFYFLIFKVI